MKEQTIGYGGLEIIKRYEGFRAEPYLCPAGVPTIGYGTTVYPAGMKVTLKDPPMNELAAAAMLRYQVDEYYGKAVNRYVHVPLTQHQFDALVSFAYNVGLGNLKNSTLLRKLNRGDYTGAANEFRRWNRTGGRVLKGLTKRRQAERDLFKGIA